MQHAKRSVIMLQIFTVIVSIAKYAFQSVYLDKCLIRSFLHNVLYILLGLHIHNYDVRNINNLI